MFTTSNKALSLATAIVVFTCFSSACSYIYTCSYLSRSPNILNKRWLQRGFPFGSTRRAHKGTYKKVLFLNAVRSNKESLQVQEKESEDEFQFIKEMASDALMPVFYGTKVQLKGKSEKQDLKYMSPEKALKRALRHYQQEIDATSPSSSPSSKDERQRARKMLADLVLGTSIMRIRYYHLLDQHEGNFRPSDKFGLMKKIQINGVQVAGDSSDTVVATDIDEDMQDEVNTRQRNTIRAMIDMHADYIRSGGDDNHEDSHINMGIIANDVNRISIQYSLPLFLVKILVGQYGIEIVEQMAAVFNESGPITLRRNEIKCSSDDELCQRLWIDNSAKAFPLSTLDSGLNSDPGKRKSFKAPRGCVRLVPNDSWSPSKTSIWSMEAWKDGCFEVMDAGSQLIVEATEVKNGEVVIDYCAGNGGKTLAMASRMYHYHGEGTGSGTSMCNGREEASFIIAHDIVKERLRQIRGSLDRAGIPSDDTTRTSTTSSPSFVTIKTTLDMNITLHEGMADCVLVDAPCSSVGVLRRRPSQRFALKEDSIVNYFPKLQLEILEKAAKLVKPGGRLIYATCSITKYENEDVVDAFESGDSFKSMDDWERWSFSDNFYSDNQNGMEEDKSHCRVIIPTRDGCDGFFIARWKKIL